MKKRKDECQFCTSRSCHNRIYRKEEPKYDEVYCYKHIREAEVKVDEILGRNNGISRTHQSSTGKLRRGEEWTINN